MHLRNHKIGTGWERKLGLPCMSHCEEGETRHVLTCPRQDSFLASSNLLAIRFRVREEKNTMPRNLIWLSRDVLHGDTTYPVFAKKQTRSHFNWTRSAASDSSSRTAFCTSNAIVKSFKLRNRETRCNVMCCPRYDSCWRGLVQIHRAKVRSGEKLL